MSVIYKVVTRPSDPRVPNSPKKYYPHLITLGQSVNLKYIAQKMQGYSSLSIGDIKSVIQNFVEKMKEQLLDVLDTANFDSFKVQADKLLEAFPHMGDTFTVKGANTANPPFTKSEPDESELIRKAFLKK